MKKLLYLNIFLFLVTAITLDAQETNFTQQKIGQVFYLNVPDYMVRTVELNDVASVQYQNSQKEAYTIVLKDEKEEMKLAGSIFANAKEFYNFFINDFNVEGKAVSNESEIIINNLKSYQAYVTGIVNEVKIFYLVTIVETPNNFYNILSWTTEEKKDELLEDYKKIASSLKE